MTGSHTIAAPPEPRWWRDPKDGLAHAFRGLHRICANGPRWWNATMPLVGPIEAVDRARACADCLRETGAVPA